MKFKNFNLNNYINSITPTNPLYIHLSKKYPSQDYDYPYYSYIYEISTPDDYFYTLHTYRYFGTISSVNNSKQHLLGCTGEYKNLTINDLYTKFNKIQSNSDISNQDYKINEFYERFY